ncbi:hypothetical protein THELONIOUSMONK_64 [Mycobacterium phage TheloniousMonk]|uniref:hypothetical protein n=1 Tax=Mycobacterium phage TheloniousMonk TaxID=1701845 RepID=UPI0006BD0A38|nr:hypothetical protein THELONIOUSMONK_64 [Mycobacterium phage TheloniousMonk]ALA06206.1 hypothetical protein THELONIOUSMONK_64 [Mycobacterium phage TheloniousMonk]
MTNELRDVLTEALKAHKPTMKRISHPRRQGFLLNLDACIGCEWTEQDGGDHDSHVADVIASLPGVAVIQLPEATYAEYPDEWSSSTAPEDEWDTWVDGRGTIQVRTQGYATADGARTLAAALLAAAVVAEGEDNHA